jgi:hypothetical protein
MTITIRDIPAACGMGKDYDYDCDSRVHTGRNELASEAQRRPFIRDDYTMIAAAVQCDVDGISKGLHDASVQSYPGIHAN